MSGGKLIVTIDGPSGGGKSTVSRLLAAKLRFTYLDTGAMYRAVAYLCREQGIDPADAAGLTALLSTFRVTLLPPGAGEDDVRVLINDQEVGKYLRTPEMGMLASRVSALPLVRSCLTRMQQEMGMTGRIVA
ncbi:MAG: (d)CMP kinase, partial [Desulfobulbus sp.]|nr:(d)CMP kinase [Desulfobulbus sp.]